MRKLLALIFACLLLSATVAEAASFHLKNGMVIDNVTAYKKLDGKYLLEIYGGTVEIPASDVLKIVDKGTPTAPPQPLTTAPAPAEPDAARAERDRRIAELKKKIEEVDGRLAEIKKVEDEEAKLKSELNDAMLRVEVLFQKGRSAALAAGKDVSVWFQFLTPQEREWAQINTLRKTEIEDKLKKLEAELQPLLEEKESVLEEKKAIEEELAQLQR